MSKISNIILLFILVDSVIMNAQDKDTLAKTSDILLYQSFGDYGAEFYKVDSRNSFLDNHILFQPYVNNLNIFNIEFGIVNSYQEEGNFTTPGDLSLSYQRNFISKKYKSTGFQGIAVRIKFTLPTGKLDYYSGHDTWALEPLIGTQWLLENPDWFTSAQVRYYYSLSALPGKSPRFNFIWLEYFFGYENQKVFFILSPDYRFIPNNSKHNLFLGIEIGYKVSSQIGIRSEFKPKVTGDEFYESLFLLGFYIYLNLNENDKKR